MLTFSYRCETKSGCTLWLEPNPDLQNHSRTRAESGILLSPDTWFSNIDIRELASCRATYVAAGTQWHSLRETKPPVPRRAVLKHADRKGCQSTCSMPKTTATRERRAYPQHCMRSSHSADSPRRPAVSLDQPHAGGCVGSVICTIQRMNELCARLQARATPKPSVGVGLLKITKKAGWRPKRRLTPWRAFKCSTVLCWQSRRRTNSDWFQRHGKISCRPAKPMYIKGSAQDAQIEPLL